MLQVLFNNNSVCFRNTLIINYYTKKLKIKSRVLIQKKKDS